MFLSRQKKLWDLIKLSGPIRKFGAKTILRILTATARMKRRKTSGGSVTGGTGDVKPQYLTMSTSTPGSADDYQVQQITLPVVRPSEDRNATIIEFLSIDYYPNVANLADQSSAYAMMLASNIDRSSGDAASAATIAQDIADPRTIAPVFHYNNFTTSGQLSQSVPIHFDFTDNNGNGMLYASDQIFLVGASIGDSVQGFYIAKLKYRFVTVGLIEYIGIVQQQQS